jgi:hypothetical protein
VFRQPSIHALKGLINTRGSSVDEQFIAAIRGRAADAFFKAKDEGSLYYKASGIFLFTQDDSPRRWRARSPTTRKVVGELTGRVSTRRGDPFPGTESRGLLNLGGRYTRGSVRLDAAVFFGLTTVDPTIGFTTGFTYVFNAFQIP